MPKRSQDQDTIPGSVFGLHLVEYLASQSQPRSMTEITTSLDLSRSRVFRHLQALVSAGYLDQCEDTDRYSIGSRSLSLGALLEKNGELIEVSMPILQALRSELGHTVVLSVVERDGMRVVASIVGTSPFEIGVRRGVLLSSHATAQGRIALAFGSPQTQSLVLGKPMEALTPETVTDPRKLRSQLKKVVEQGWATAPNESLVGLNALAAPIWNARNVLVASIAIVDSIQRISEDPSQTQVRAVVKSANDISEKLGATAL